MFQNAITDLCETNLFASLGVALLRQGTLIGPHQRRVSTRRKSGRLPYTRRSQRDLKRLPGTTVSCAAMASFSSWLIALSLSSSFLLVQPPTSPSLLVFSSAFLLRRLLPQRAHQSRSRRRARRVQSRPRRQPRPHPECSQPCLCLHHWHPDLDLCHPCLPPRGSIETDARSGKPSCQPEAPRYALPRDSVEKLKHCSAFVQVDRPD